jgi:hypothetical protein
LPETWKPTAGSYRRASQRVALLGAVALLGWGAADLGAAPQSEARALVEAYNARNFGGPGRRQVRLELRNGATVVRTFVVSNLWRTQGDQVKTLFVLEEPRSLRGTNYLLIEEPAAPSGMQVYLHLPVGQKRVLSVEPSSFDEGLLGSDFGYRDLRMRLPVAGLRFAVVGQDRLLERPVQVVEARAEGAAAPTLGTWAASRFYLSQNPPLLLGADHFRQGQGGRLELVKTLRVEGVRQVDGAWTETRMVMTAADGRSSVLSLDEFQPAYAAGRAELFEPEALPGLIDRLASLPSAAVRGGAR